MLNPNMPNIPGMGAMTDTLEFVKNFWGSMGIPGAATPGINMPGMVLPTLSVDEIRKRISDLRAVESWLDLNMNMLRGTIQALEVQAATISTLQTMGEALSATVNASTVNINAGTANINPQSGQEAPQAPEEAAPTWEAGRKASATPEPTSRDQADAANLTAPFVNAAAWWNMLQDQFRQAVNTAMTAAETPVPDGADRTAGKAEEKPASKKSASGSTRRRKASK